MIGAQSKMTINPKYIYKNTSQGVKLQYDKK